MTILQIMVIAVVCTLATVPDGIVLPDRAADWGSVAYMAVVVGALGCSARRGRRRTCRRRAARSS